MNSWDKAFENLRIYTEDLKADQMCRCGHLRALHNVPKLTCKGDNTRCDCSQFMVDKKVDN